LNNKYKFDNYVRYYNIRKTDEGVTEHEIFYINKLNINNPPIILEINKPDNIKVIKDSYNVIPIKGPNINKLYGRNILNIKNKSSDALSFSLVKDDKVSDYTNIYRLSGPYEPIFKDIKMFKDPVFCYIDYITGTTTGYTDEMMEAEDGKNADPSGMMLSIKEWKDIDNICGDQGDPYYTYARVERGTTGSTYHLVLNKFDFEIPYGATISGITVSINRRTHVPSGNWYYVKDNVISLTDSYSYNPYYNMCENKSGETVWSTDYSSVTYGGESDLWDKNALKIINWTPDLINSDEFGVIIKCFCENSMGASGPGWDILPDIKCVSVTVRYVITSTTVDYESFIYFNGNEKFDESLYNFGMIDEVIYSKVNIEGKNILRFDNAKYPIVDQFGYGYTDRFVFKSDWDKNFYYNTLDKFDDE